MIDDIAFFGFRLFLDNEQSQLFGVEERQISTFFVMIIQHPINARNAKRWGQEGQYP